MKPNPAHTKAAPAKATKRKPPALRRRAMQQLAAEERDMEAQHIREAQSEIEASRSTYADLYDFAPVACLDLDSIGNIRAANITAGRLLGGDLYDIKNHPFLPFVSKTDHRKFLSHLSALRRGIEQVTTELTLEPVKSEPIPVELRSHRTPHHPGKGWCFRSALIDLTERKQIEAALAAAKEKAEAASRAKDEFIATLSHELRTPLNPVLMLASAMELSPDLPDSLRADFGMIRKNVELEARLIDDLLDLTRITRGKIRLDCRTVDAHQLMRQTTQMLDGQISAKSLDLQVNLKARHHNVWADPVRLHQIFMNVFNNAVKFTPPHGSVSVCSSNHKGRINIEIRDTGIGIERDEIERIFDSFGQGHHSGTERFGGLGLGLTISRLLLELQNGKISASSDGRGKGALFIIEMPLAEVA